MGGGGGDMKSTQICMTSFMIDPYATVEQDKDLFIALYKVV